MSTSQKDNTGKLHSGYMTTTELAKLCGVSRFTIINWVKQDKIKVTRTVGGHCRIPVSEALSLLKTFQEKKTTAVSDLPDRSSQQIQLINDNGERGNCLTGNENNKQIKDKNKNVLYAFGYGVGRGMHVLKGRSKVK